MEIARQIARHLLRIEAVKLQPQQPFTWASGRKAPIYCVNRTLLFFPDIRSEVIQAFVQKASFFLPVDAVAGVATAGIPHGVLLADRLGLPFLYVRAKPKEHGRQNQIEGVVKPGQRLLVIEDLISTGGSSLAAVEALRESGADVKGVLAIFSYGFPEAELAFRQASCPMDTLTDYATLLQEAISTGSIQPADLDTLYQWRKNPAHWPTSCYLVPPNFFSCFIFAGQHQIALETPGPQKRKRHC